ncbi:hypothetical protein B0T10DRAFT_579642 [Thelonectria olida]|uniref:Uncharacterized protein n=1 Tax=Thelonectria olida TaxID=1576542 RepID=A0A9P8VYS6_9HYPO|nr:hypothetical protein B0T10DRAFT_579642 [Thelonectria olida]
MMNFLLLLSLLGCIWASPTPPTHLSIFDNDSIPVVNQPDLKLFNFRAHTRGVGVEKRALDLAYILFDITFDGRNQGNYQSFLVRGELLITWQIPSPGTRNGVNPVDVAIAIGNPSIRPVAGSIRYVTNRYLNPLIGGSRDISRIDFARVSTTSNTVVVSVDTSIAASNQISVFNARSGLFADVYNPANGWFNLNLWNNGQIWGKISLGGRSLISGAWAPYQASISGRAKQKGRLRL